MGILDKLFRDNKKTENINERKVVVAKTGEGLETRIEKIRETGVISESDKIEKLVVAATKTNSLMWAGTQSGVTLLQAAEGVGIIESTEGLSMEFLLKMSMLIMDIHLEI